MVDLDHNMVFNASAPQWLAIFSFTLIVVLSTLAIFFFVCFCYLFGCLIGDLLRSLFSRRERRMDFSAQPVRVCRCPDPFSCGKYSGCVYEEDAYEDEEYQ